MSLFSIDTPRRNAVLGLCIFTAFIFSSCKDSDDPSGPSDLDFKFPLVSGNQWTYSLSNTFSNIRPDSIKYLLHEFSGTFNVVVTGDTVLDSNQVTEIRHFGYSGSSMSYFANHDTGFFKYGYTAGGGPLFLKSTRYKYLLRGKYYESPGEIALDYTEGIGLHKSSSDSIYIENPPRKILHYPMIKGMEWTYFSDPGFLIINKTVEGTETVTTQSGMHFCQRIRWNYDWNGDGTWENFIQVTEYFSNAGLVKRIVLVKDIAITTEEKPDGIGFADSKTETLLITKNF